MHYAESDDINQIFIFNVSHSNNAYLSASNQGVVQATAMVVTLASPIVPLGGGDTVQV